MKLLLCLIANSRVVRCLQLETTEGLITAVPENPNMFVQVLTRNFQ
jgi:hypothetical protein